MQTKFRNDESIFRVKRNYSWKRFEHSRHLI